MNDGILFAKIDTISVIEI